MNLKKMERYLRVNLLGPGLRLMKKRIYRAAVSQSLRNNVLENTHCCSYKHAWVNLLLSTVLHLLRVQSVTSRTSNLCTPLNITDRQNTTQRININSHAQATTTFLPYIFVTAIRRLLVTHIKGSGFPLHTANKFKITTTVHTIKCLCK